MRPLLGSCWPLGNGQPHAGGHHGPARRRAIAGAIAAAAAAALGPRGAGAAGDPHPVDRWYQAALAMRHLAESWGDQAYGAVLVQDGRLIGLGPSRVIQRNNPDAHAEREAIADALARVGAARVRGAVMYSTSRPCSLCERAAARAGVARMYHGPGLTDAGVPSGG